MQYNFKGKYETTQSYAVKDVVSYQPTVNDAIKYYMCLSPNSNTNQQVPNQTSDSQFWGILNASSNFPQGVDSFLFRVNPTSNDKVELDRLNFLNSKSSLTTIEQEELATLFAKHRNKLLLADDLNAIQDSVSNLQLYFKDNVEANMNAAVTSIESKKDEALVLIETKKNNIITYMDGTTAGSIRNDMGDMGVLTTSNKSSLIAAINELDGDIGDKSTLSTTNKTNVVNAINEVNAKFSKLETRTTDPTSPVVGQMWLRTDL